MVESCSESKRGKEWRKVVNLLIEVAPSGKGEDFEGGREGIYIMVELLPKRYACEREREGWEGLIEGVVKSDMRKLLEVGGEWF